MRSSFLRKKEHAHSFLKKLDPTQLSLLQLKKVFIGLLTAFLLISFIACAWLYNQAEQKSRDALILNMSVMEASSAAETIKATDGSLKKAAKLLRSHRDYTLDDDSLLLYYDDEMRPASESCAFYMAQIRREKKDGCYCFTITISACVQKYTVYELVFKIPERG
ncbi:MAG: hypothetical protein Q4C46_04510 [Bacillota bacterium]|nr:hypothetical protein [Bacillota bacterium]